MDKQHPYQITLEWSEEDFYQKGVTGISRLPTPDVVAHKSELALQGTMVALQDIGERVSHTLRTMDDAPNLCEIEFGIRLGAESGVITKSNETAHFVIKLVWRMEE